MSRGFITERNMSDKRDFHYDKQYQVVFAHTEQQLS